MKATTKMSGQEKLKLEKKRNAECALISKCYNCILEKVKDMRQSFSKAVISGPRSGSGKVVYEHYDSLMIILGGSSNTKLLQTAVDSSLIVEIEGREGFRS